ncbi:MAG TPA: glycine zipper 2TM domain-containing protein [Rhodocyclaceae bacterium]|jgi:outer membrane lipoprotein SlyB|nr:glycine zipper 2TM domain-containing protein [Rhodocyclaceae bacterium]
MNKLNILGGALGLASVLALGACSTTGDYYDPGNANRAYAAPPSTQTATVYSGYGVVKGIEVIRQDGTTSNVGLGTVAGAIIGGVVGHQIGGGTGNTVATVAGVAGGAYAGHQLENRRQQAVDAYKVTILMDGGTYQTLILNSNPGLRLEDRVVVDNGVVRRY